MVRVGRMTLIQKNMKLMPVCWISCWPGKRNFMKKSRYIAFSSWFHLSFPSLPTVVFVQLRSAMTPPGSHSALNCFHYQPSTENLFKFISFL